MPWKASSVMEERLRFVARLLDGETMTALCAEFGISRKTGYKIYDRYKDYGVHGLTDRSRRPYRHANQLPLVLASSGELVAERSGVLNLGLEGIMLVGAVTGFMATISTGSLVMQRER